MKKTYLSSLFLGLMLVATPAAADRVEMVTQCPLGEKISIAMNKGVKATLTWNNGEVEKMEFDGMEKSIVVKDSVFRIEAEQPIVSLYCADCQLTQLQLFDMMSLRSLNCANNQLKKLNVEKAVYLERLNCEQNQIEQLNLLFLRGLKELNLSENKMRYFANVSFGEMENLDVSYNQMEELYLGSALNLVSLCAQNNPLNYIALNDDCSPRDIFAFDGSMTNFYARNSFANTKVLWLDNNRLNGLELDTAKLETFSASNCRMHTVRLNPANAENLQEFYVENNRLLPNSLPTLQNAKFKYRVFPQQPYPVPDTLQVGQPFHVSQRMNFNGWGEPLQAKMTVKDAEDHLLTPKVDYELNDSVFVFLHAFKNVHAEVTSPLYAGMTFETTDVQVIDPTGIDDICVKDPTVLLSPEPNRLNVTAKRDTVVRIYDRSGALVVQEKVKAGQHSWLLPEGVYVVNGQKVTVGR